MGGARVVIEHPEFGPGEVLSAPLVPGPGPPLVVRFGQGLRCLPRDELRLLDGSGWPGLAGPRHREELSHAQREASVWLEALRFGTVSESGSQLLTVGRDKELEILDEDLRQSREQGGACRVFCGAYGVGKSHLLEIARRKALKKGVGAMSAVLDRQKITPSRPRRLMRELLLNLELPERSERGAELIAWVLDRVTKVGSEMLKGGIAYHHYLSPLLAAWKSLDGSQLEARQGLLHWICGGERTRNSELRRQVARAAGQDPGALYAFKDHRTVWNQLTYLLSGWSFLLRESGLCAGLMLLLDEAEMCAATSRSQQAQGDKCLTGLCAATLGRRGVNQPKLLSQRGGHHATRDFPAFYQARSHLYLALGMATDSQGRECLARILPTRHFLELAPLEFEAVEVLLARILGSYATAFPHFSLGPGFAAPLGQLLLNRGHPIKTPRQVVQQALGFLDGARLWQGSVEHYVEAFVETYD